MSRYSIRHDCLRHSNVTDVDVELDMPRLVSYDSTDPPAELDSHGPFDLHSTVEVDFDS